MTRITYFLKVVSLCTLGVIGPGFLSLGAAQTDQYPSGEWETIIESQDFTETLELDTGDDNTLILDATFHDIDGSGIMIRNVSNVYIKNCTIYNIKEDGIVLRSTGSTQNVTIDGCTISNVGKTGILAKQNEEEDVDHINLIVKNNTVHDTGATEYDHGMYIFSTDSLVENNVVYGTSGNGISMRSSGVVRGNKVWDTRESCIKYYSNHAPGVSNALTIENNVCQLREAGAGDPGISLRRADEAPETWMLQDYYIRFNTVVLRTSERYGFAITSPEFDSRHVELYGNIFINTEDSSKTVNPEYVDYLSSNYTSSSLAGFINPNKSPYDLQLKADAPARYYASTEANFPGTDINGIIRAASYLDAGAYQFSTPPAELIPEGQDSEDVAKPATEDQAHPSVETPGPTTENSERSVAKDKAEPSVKASDEPPEIQSSGLLAGNLLYFMFPLVLLLIIGIIVVFRRQVGR